MDIAEARKAYDRQRYGARSRGIGWELTFEQWLEWWGADIERRGRGRDDLQMCRDLDAGPYALGNIHKGTMHSNVKTAGRMHANRASEKRRREHHAIQDALMWAPSEPPRDEIDENEFDVLESAGAFPRPWNGVFKADKRR